MGEEKRRHYSEMTVRCESSERDGEQDIKDVKKAKFTTRVFYGRETAAGRERLYDRQTRTI